MRLSDDFPLVNFCNGHFIVLVNYYGGTTLRTNGVFNQKVIPPLPPPSVYIFFMLLSLKLTQSSFSNRVNRKNNYTIFYEWILL
jgi:hypothetical protein